MLQVEVIRALFTYLIATIVVIGGGLILYTVRAEPDAGDTITIVAAFIGSALTFVFGAEVQARTARQSAAATLAGSSSQAVANGHAVPLPHAE